MKRRPMPHGTARGGFTLLEVLVALGVMLAGILALAAAFPMILSSQRDAEILTVAAAMAQRKAEEIRRDNDQDDRLIDAIRERDTPTDPVVFPIEPRLSYSFSGESLLYNQPGDPRAASNVPRVIIRYASSFRSSQDVIYELRFDQIND